MCSKYGLQNPRDPNVSREIKIDKFDPEIVDKKMINEKVGELVANGDITSRKDVVNFLEKAGGKITRLGKDYLSVKFDDKPKAIRLRGAYYSDQSFSEIRRAGLEAAKAKFSDQTLPKNSRPSIAKSKPSDPPKLKNDTTSKDLQLREQTILIANLQRNLAITQSNLTILKSLYPIMTTIVVALTTLLLVTQR